MPAPRTAADACAQIFDVVVIGGGASGLAAGIAAARAGAAVCVLESDVEAGLSILATGNGRCNLSNARLEPERYRHPETFQKAAGAHPEADLQAFFTSLGLMVAQEDQGRLYPRTKRAESVRAVLLDACARDGVALRCGCTPTAARHDPQVGLWRLTAAEPQGPLHPKGGHDTHSSLRNARKALAAAQRTQRPLLGRRVIIACGGRAARLAELFGLPCLPEEPVLCPIACTLALEGGCGALDGLRVEGALTLVQDGAVRAREEGEVLFRAYGVSGIAAFNLSRHLHAGRAAELELDLFPELGQDELERALLERGERIGALADAGPSWFDGVLPRELGAPIFGEAVSCARPVRRAAALLKRLRLADCHTTLPEQAQVHRGGVPVDAVDPRTLAVRPQIAPALHVCGEALDMDADCGGFNLAWAWLSGMRAGSSAAALSNEKSFHA